MDEDAKRRFLADEAEKHTARLEVERTEPGVYVAKSRGVRKFRLLLDRDAFDPRTPVRVTWNGRARTHRLTRSARVLCEEFVERFDRTFLPVAEFRVP